MHFSDFVTIFSMNVLLVKFLELSNFFSSKYYFSSVSCFFLPSVLFNGNLNSEMHTRVYCCKWQKYHETEIEFLFLHLHVAHQNRIFHDIQLKSPYSNGHNINHIYTVRFWIKISNRNKTLSNYLLLKAIIFIREHIYLFENDFSSLVYSTFFGLFIHNTIITVYSFTIT